MPLLENLKLGKQSVFEEESSFKKLEKDEEKFLSQLPAFIGVKRGMINAQRRQDVVDEEAILKREKVLLDVSSTKLPEQEQVKYRQCLNRFRHFKASFKSILHSGRSGPSLLVLLIR